MKVSHRKQERVDQQTRIRVGTQMSLKSGSKATGSQQGSPTLLFVLQSYSLPRLCLPLWSMSFLSQLLPWSLLLWHENHQTVWVLQTCVWCWPGCCLVSSWGSWSLYHTLWGMVAISTQNPVQLKWKTPSWPCTKPPRLLGKKQNKRNQKTWPLCQPWKIPSQWTKCLLRQNVNIPQGNLETVLQSRR